MQLKSRKQILYEEVIKPSLIKEFEHQNENEVASLKAIYLSICFGKREKKNYEEWLEIIGGQKPAVTKAKQSIAQFGIREGSDIGYRVSLRSDMMYNFLDRLFIALLNDKGLKSIPMKSFTQHKKGKTVVTMSMGIKDITIFHGVMVRSTERQGMNITFVVNSKSKMEAAKLLESLDLPIEYGEKK